MRTFICLLFLAALLPVYSAPEQPDPFNSIVNRVVYESLALSPVSATASGYHQHQGVHLDQLLDDYSHKGLEKQRALYRELSAGLRQIEKSKLNPEQQADYELVRYQVDLGLLELDTIQSYKHNPTNYIELIGTALNTPFLVEYAPKPQRFRDIIARLNEVPTLLDQARQNLVSAPAIWIQVAKAENAGTRDLIDKELRAAVPQELSSDYSKAATNALTALSAFDQYLDGSLSAKPYPWQLGGDAYAKKFPLALQTDEAPDIVLAAAEQLMVKTRNEMETICKSLQPKYGVATPSTGGQKALIRAVLDKVAESHAKPETYFQEAEQDLAEAQQFVQKSNLVPLPTSGNLKVIPTPAFMRGIYGVGGFNPAPPFEPQLGAFYWITPLDYHSDQQAVQSKLREYNTYGLKILTIHEAMPGHFVQSEYANDIQPESRRLLRAIFGSGAYVEGWAVYVTEAMLDAGYLQNSPELRLTFLKQQLRVFANTILDVRLQAKGMTDAEAMKLMLDDGFQEKAEATAKLQRAKLSSCQLPLYLVGWRDWHRMRTQLQKAQGTAFNLTTFHQRALQEGALPLPTLTRLLLQKQP